MFLLGMLILAIRMPASCSDSRMLSSVSRKPGFSSAYASNQYSLLHADFTASHTVFSSCSACRRISAFASSVAWMRLLRPAASIVTVAFASNYAQARCSLDKQMTRCSSNIVVCRLGCVANCLLCSQRWATFAGVQKVGHAKRYS